MRSILNVSLPGSVKKVIQKRAKEKGVSVSAYVLYAVEVEKQMMSEDEVLVMAKRAEKDYVTKKTKVLKSLKDLV